MQSHVSMVRFGLWEESVSMRDVLRFALITSGGQCVMTTGMQVTLKWSALNLKHPSAQVHHCFHQCPYALNPLYHPVSIGQALSNAFFGQGSGPIFLDNVACSGTERTLLSCNSGQIGSHNCGHKDDAGVKCSGMQTIKRCGSSFYVGKGQVEWWHVRVFTK